MLGLQTTDWQLKKKRRYQRPRLALSLSRELPVGARQQALAMLAPLATLSV
jgi:hypothetical protein